MSYKFTKQIDVTKNPDMTLEELALRIAAGQYGATTTLADILLNSDLNAGVVRDTQTLTDGATINWDASLGSTATVVIAGNRTIAFPTNLVAGGDYRLIITQDETGSRTITSWDAMFRFNAMTAPTLTTTAQYSDVIDFYYDGTYLIETSRKTGFKLYEDPPPPPSVIQSIQNVTITIAGASTTGTATISSVTEANTVLILNGSGSEDSNDPRGAFARITLTNATTITATRGIASGSPCVVRVCVIEFAAGVITSKQSGTATFSTITATATLGTAVNRTYACVIPQGFTASGTPDTYGWVPALSLTAASTVTFYYPGNPASLTMGYTVIEFDAANIQSIQNINDSGSETTTSKSITISSVTTANTLVIPGGCANNGAGNWSDGGHVMSLTGSTTLQIQRSGTESVTARTCAAVIEFVSGVVNSRQDGSLSSNATSQTATITSVDTTKAAAVFMGLRTTVTTGNLQNTTGSISLTAATTVTTYKPAAGGTSFRGYQIVEFI